MTHPILAAPWHFPEPATAAVYALLTITGLILSTLIWRKTPRSGDVPALVYVGALLGAISGAKLGYLICEAPFIPHDDHFWMNLLVGRTILGGLLGGYVGVEIAKVLTHYTRPTGDIFALAVPLGIAVGRVGCIIHGCCPGTLCNAAWYAMTGVDGRPRFPVAAIELTFQLTALATLWAIYKQGRLRGQLFNVYLIAYATFRITIEPFRQTPKLFGFVSTYQLLSGAILIFAAIMFQRRAKAFTPIKYTAE